MQWRPYGAVWHIYDNKAPPQTHTSPPFSTELLGPPFAVPKSPQRCASQPPSWDPRWDSRLKTSVHDRCGPAVPWPSSWHVSTRTRSASWVGVTATSCCTTSTRRQIHSRKDLHRAWSNMGTTRSSRPPMGTKKTAPRLWASPKTLLGYSGRPGIGLVKIRQINSTYHTNFSKSIPSTSVESQIPLAGKMVLDTVTSREKGVTTRACTQAHAHPTFTEGLASCMVQHGDYALIPPAHGD